VPADVLARAGLGRGDKVLAHTGAADGTWLLGTRSGLVIVGASSAEPPASVESGPSDGPVETIRWEQVETADWNRDEERFRIAEVGEFGQPRPVHEFTLSNPGRLLQLIRERVTASVLLQRRVELPGSRSGLTVVARRSPHRDGEISWAVEYDVGVDPADPAVVEVATAGLRAAQDEVGSI
jgi:hypothetical protein